MQDERDQPAAQPPIPDEYLAEPDRYFLEWIPRKLAEERALRERIESRIGSSRTVAQIHLTGEAGGSWHFVLESGAVTVDRGQHERPSFTVTLAVDTWRALRRGEMSGMSALMRGKIKLAGSKLALLRVGRIFG